MIKDQERLPLGIVVERRKLDNPWREFSWRPVTVIPGAGPMDPAAAWTEIAQGEDRVRFHAGTLPLNLFPKETEGYRVNLSQEPPRLFVIMRSSDEPDSRHEFESFLVTACPYEAQDYLDSGDDLVEAVAMPEAVIAFVQSYVDQHHLDEPFHKRKRKRWAEQGPGVGLRSSTASEASSQSEEEGEIG